MAEQQQTNPDEQVRDAIKAWIADQDEDDVMVVNYAVVTEVVSVGDSTSPWLKIISNDGLASWSRPGMAHALVQTCKEDLRAGWEGDE